MVEPKYPEKGVSVDEKWRVVMFDNGEHITLHGVTHVDDTGNYLRLMCEEGYILINKERVLCHRIPASAMVW